MTYEQFFYFMNGFAASLNASVQPGEIAPPPTVEQWRRIKQAMHQVEGGDVVQAMLPGHGDNL